jgi:phage shock protein PspC (stress-responsive transcriptional regulator)
MIGGVAGGVAEYFDVDPVLVRIAFVALLVVSGGLFAVAYIVAMIVMPIGDGVAGSRHLRQHRHHEPSAAVGIVLGVLLVAAGAVALAQTLDVPAPPWEAIFAGLLVLAGIGIIVDARNGVHGGLVALGIVLTVLAAAASATPHLGWQSGFGDRTVHPQTMSDLDSNYSHAFGSMTVDLRDLHLPAGTTHLDVSEAFGSVDIRLPAGVAARITGQDVFGSADVLGRSFSGVSADHTVETPGYATADHRIEIDLSDVFGSATVR